MKIKTLKKIILIILITIGFIGVANSQEHISLSIHQDLRLLVKGDDKGNEALTPNIIAKVNLQGNQQEWGYMTISPEFEYANLKGGVYQRYSGNIGYTFNKLIINKLEANTSVGWGWINRNEFTYSSLAFSGALNYKLSDRFKISTLLQLVDRTDLEIPELRVSAMVGIEIVLN